MNKILKSYFYWTYSRGKLPLRRDGDADPALHLRHSASVGLRRQALPRCRPRASHPGRRRRRPRSHRLRAGLRRELFPPALQTAKSRRPCARPSSPSPATPFTSSAGRQPGTPRAIWSGKSGRTAERFCARFSASAPVASNTARISMHLSRKLALRRTLRVPSAAGPPACLAADDLQRVLHQLDVAAADFHTTSADFEFDSVQTDPIPDTDVQKGQVYYERKGKSFKMAAHIREVNGKPVPKVYTYADGVFKLYEPMINQVTTFNKAGKFESYVMLGFGASGKELAEKWNIKYLGQETDRRRQDRQARTGRQGPHCPQKPSQSHHLDRPRARHQPQAGLRRRAGPVTHLPLLQHQGQPVPARRRLQIQDRQQDSVHRPLTAFHRSLP